MRLAGAVFLIGCLFWASVFASSSSSIPELRIYAYDSFLSSGGLGPQIIPTFEKRCHCKVRVLPCGDAGGVLTRIQLDQKRGKANAHLALGLDLTLTARARAWIEPWGSWRPQGWEELDVSSSADRTDFLPPDFLPIDQGYFAWIADRSRLKALGLEAPRSVRDLLAPIWKRKLLLQDPRTSSPGLAWLLFTRSVLGAESLSSFWRDLRTQWLTLSPGWEGAYGLFLQEEAPLVWSYIESQAYHAEHGDRGESRFIALTLAEGTPTQVEGAVAVRGAFAGAEGASALVLAREFLGYLISSEVQILIPRTQWMHPVRKNTPLPPSFLALPQPVKTAFTTTAPLEIDQTIALWRNAVVGHP